MTRVWAWLRRCWGWLLAGLIGLVLLLVGGSWVVRRLGRLRDEATFDEATARVAHLEGQREEVRAQRAETAAERARVEARVREIDRELLHQRRLAIASFEGGEGLSDAEIERAYREVLGAR